MTDRTAPDFDPVAEVQSFLDSRSFTKKIIHTDATIFTVQDASAAVGAPECEILKSILLRVNSGAYYALALMSGVNRVDIKKIKKLLGEKHLSFASPEECISLSGFRPGGVPPVGYPEQPRTLIDEDLFLYDTVWAAAGTDHHFFPVSPAELAELTGGEKLDIKSDK